MQGFLAVLLLLNPGYFSGAGCPPTDVNTTSSGATVNLAPSAASLTCLNISGRGVSTISGWHHLGSQLEALDLSHNHLRSLPRGFLNNSVQLKELRLEGNPLASVPASVFHIELELSVDCECNLVGGISSHCQQLACTSNISCLSNQGFFDITDFYPQQCQGPPVVLYVSITISVLVLLLGAALGWVLIRRGKGSATVQEKWESSTSNGSQPRYISHSGPQVNPAQGGHADYENIFIGPMQEARGGHKKDQYSRKQPKSWSHRKAQKDEPPLDEQPVYANTQELYYNCAGTPAPPEDDVYIMPDQ